MRKVLILALFVILINGVLPSGTSLHASFNPDVSAVYESPIIYSDALSFELSTSERVLCRYGTNKDTSFDSMTGNFDDHYETIHKEVFTNLNDGVHRYYVKCRDIDDLGNYSKGVESLEVIFKISSPIKGQIVLGDSSHLGEGKHEVTLVTTRIPSNVPKLSYSFNNIVYNPIALQGSDTVWKGFLFIPKDHGESVGSFKFEAHDLEGRLGYEAVGDVVFSVDTVAPGKFTTIGAVGDYGEIKLDWYLEDEVESILIYRSEETGVDKTDFFVEIDGAKESFVDDEVTKGKTYYYKIAATDRAGNLAELSREISATVLLNEGGSTQNTGLALNLRGLVDNMLTEISILSDDLKDIENSYDFEENVQEIFDSLDLGREVNDVKKGLEVLEREVQNYKLQDLTREALESKLNSATLKMNILKKRFPETFVILNEKKVELSTSEDDLRRLLLEHKPEMEDKEISERVKSSMKFMEEKKVSFSGQGYVLEVVYLDGTRKEFSYVEHEVKSEAKREGDFDLMILLPNSFVREGNLDMDGLDYNFEKDNLVSFGRDVEEVKYNIDKKISTGTFEEVLISFVDVSVEDRETNSGITGYSIFNFSEGSSTGFTFLMLFVFVLVGYLGYLKFIQKSGTESELVFDFVQKARQVKELKKVGDMEKANKVYESLKADYLSMDLHEKKMVFKEIKKLHGGK